jgi:hypothetical protein
MRTTRTIGALAACGVLAAGAGLGMAATHQKPAATGAQAKVTVYKSPT